MVGLYVLNGVVVGVTGLDFACVSGLKGVVVGVTGLDLAGVTGLKGVVVGVTGVDLAGPILGSGMTRILPRHIDASC